MAVGTAFVGGTSLALAPLRVFLLDAEDGWIFWGWSL